MDTEQEELEALQKWWKENGRAVVVGLILGLGGVYGWITWQGQVEAAAERVSIVYESMVNMAAADDHQEALLRAEQIIKEDPDSEYAALSGLLGAKSALAAGRGEDARRLLGWVIENADRAELRDLARIRNAQLLVEEQKPDAGLELLAQVRTAAFAPTVEELRGDILVENHDSEAAAAAYRSALASDVITSGMRARVMMKLDDLGHSDDTVQAK